MDSPLSSVTGLAAPPGQSDSRAGKRRYQVDSTMQALQVGLE